MKQRPYNCLQYKNILVVILEDHTMFYTSWPLKKKKKKLLKKHNIIAYPNSEASPDASSCDPWIHEDIYSFSQYLHITKIGPTEVF